MHELRGGALEVCVLLGISDRKPETSATPCEVSWSLPNNSPPLRAMPCCSLCVCAAPMRGLLPSAAAAKSGSRPRTTDLAVPVLADAIGACSTLRPCGQGGARPRAAARERPWACF
ncbi:hypothetical protein OAO87_04625 [bacterium]|nr:hypothetical protein [bacterium]